ncbi:MAPEG family protein [Sphingomonas dokdonensis]|uniref:MAPEG family protein n=2 Tax=Sphingomonas dokdonensis TaxID=344880 RepID=A0A245ZWA4_9SPHN|nr:MAPEG family protein [Sphingomonas dokdonensis]
MSVGEFEREQRRVAWGMGAALVTAIVVIAFGVGADRALGPIPFTQRVAFTIRADAFVILWLAAGIANVARMRFFSAQDIAGSSVARASEKVREARAILQNTLEQAMLAIGAHLIVAATFSQARMSIVALVCLFGVGRLLFWIGYRRGAAARAYGFGLTFYPSLMALVACAATIAVGSAA